MNDKEVKKVLFSEFKQVRELARETPNDLYYRGYLDALTRAYSLLLGITNIQARKELLGD